MESNQGPTAPSLTPMEETQEIIPQQIGKMPSSEAPNEASQADIEAEKPSSPNKRGKMPCDNCIIVCDNYFIFVIIYFMFIYVPAPHNAEDGLSTIYDSIEKIRQSVAYWVATVEN
ncbi:zinc finger BED domain-containing protein RICESLEEPER 2-like [Senna tora]|uniref:Zinc finger BED domain-containing protein RICESLEEPER 2-like n=1 Tax=Senna tora TaxID=362788 RepID=A0A834WT60_9FABA|nr:zinc finger BED domain-containing protein RICESLEEPER 2-like [Senna tora]